MKKYTVQAWYFPNWHQTKQNDKWHGEGWTEWEVLKCARPKYEGHAQPKIPLWGYEDESDPNVFAKKIRAATEHGIDGFIFDFYWYKGSGAYRRDALDKGFLGAPNNTDMEFSVMWCNHAPVFTHPEPFYAKTRELESGAIDEELFKEVTDYCIENYFCKPNYRRIDGKCYFGIWNMAQLVNDLGSLEKAGEMIQAFKKRAADAGYPVHLACRNILAPYFGTTRSTQPLIPSIPPSAELCKKAADTLGIDSFFVYAWRLFESEQWPRLDYAKCREVNVKLYHEWAEFSPLPIDITVSTGWDASPRTVQSDMYQKSRGGNFGLILDGNTPEELEKSFQVAKDFAESDKFTGNTITIYAWNEWTEGGVMEPDEQYGYGYLEACKRVFGKNNKKGEEK